MGLEVVVDLIIPGALYDIYKTENFSDYKIETDLFSFDKGVSIVFSSLLIST